ncbi:kinase-like domain-containing protein [Rhizophagus irregularis DAOM 181602=DAOM 197198]|uniref:Rho1p n=2 Tax=Rhizophagus irregularis TaxID=588596 RepID=A0A015M4W6_RHIIW|nr:kinase-like domain-containing protein [Rhizophagus irregularis DAOM 181602=DAOM 197198]EXX61898.1 Rho1p [Rhizophagus irregularis DAOM 197198w]POG69013.1 kinase-like domain-containing protein [Rhizophagus irregularis DAOM 181602=DAOM 197198]|eukprot:XP_025175879.1 kinase-like domain-containing protein [Rhizophagus irregularis DAOM 181602=DAOM 197198]
MNFIFLAMAENSKVLLEDAFRNKLINFIPYIELEGLTKADVGNFGSISIAYWPKLRKNVAVKRLFVSEHDTASRNFVHELQIQKHVEYHDNIIRILGVSQDPSNKDHLLVLQYAKDGNLKDYLARNHLTLSWNDKYKIACGIADGLHCLHDENIVHRDLHSKNILIDHGEPKIADFGISKSLNTGTDLVNGVFGMIPYIEPKRLENPNYRHEKASDIYSLGVVLWEISSGQRPFRNSSYDAALAISIINGLRETPIAGTPQEYISLYQKCWYSNPQIRPSIVTVFQSLQSLGGVIKKSMQEIEELNHSVQYDLVIPDRIDVSAEYVDDKVLINTQSSQMSKMMQPTSQMYTKPPIEVIHTSTLKTDTSTTSEFPCNQVINNQNLQSPSFVKISISSRPSHNNILKLVVVGNGAVGKTALIDTFRNDCFRFPTNYVLAFQTFYVDVEIDGQFVDLTLRDTPGQVNYARLRELSYTDAHVCLILFAIDYPDSLDSVEGWMDELNGNFQQSELPPVLLIGTKADLRHDISAIEELKKIHQTLVTYEEGLRVANQINAVKYLECSSKAYEGINEVFEQATRAALAFSRIQKKRRRRGKCIIL